jgi:hypothetical protein
VKILAPLISPDRVGALNAHQDRVRTLS